METQARHVFMAHGQNQQPQDMLWLLYGCYICGQGVPHTSDAFTVWCICVRVNEWWGCWALSAVSAGMSVCLFVQAFPVSGDPTSVSGIFFFPLSFCLDKSSKQEKEHRQRRNTHKVKDRPGNLGEVL